MSLNSGKKTYGVPKFNGNSEKFPMFRMKFDGLIFRLGRKYTRYSKARNHTRISSMEKRMRRISSSRTKKMPKLQSKGQSKPSKQQTRPLESAVRAMSGLEIRAPEQTPAPKTATRRSGLFTSPRSMLPQQLFGTPKPADRLSRYGAHKAHSQPQHQTG